MVISTGFTEPWGDGQPRENRIIFIGRGMQERRQALTEEFNACVAKPLRFEIGDKVRVKIRDQCQQEHHDHSGHSHGHEASCEEDLWDVGVVVRHWDGSDAYKVQVSDELEIHVPLDDDRFIMPSS
eukprot:gnl/MRDRNA2_/MRDRNA2_48934_c0_seq1.p2 gnl/MRDRNA2_/MRDRNA2_48934_c0~~gnl/MRDRNA2_/MRDRNA2_48934_c0_seq1.p2  ORF type:complete len:126 (+),score=16.12 gnl/MRDRNA2_/MRDRNA2_48934_c0_seq1:218-595(+)